MPVLQARAFRSVSLEPEGGSAVVVKRFHHPNALLARFDGARARRELKALSALFARGLRVPRPLGIRRSAEAWELRVQAVSAARSLAECLEGAAPPRGWNHLLRLLGALLAQLQESGWEHRDLHPGNVLVDARGEPWLIDLQRARPALPDRARFLGEVVQCAAHVREVVSARARLGFLASWLSVLPAEHRPSLTGPALARAIEERARVWRRRSVREHLDRWLRPSSRVAPSEAGDRALVRRDLAPLTPAEVLARSPYLVHGPAQEVRARWLGAARLLEHGLPVLRPALLVPGSRWNGRGGWAAFERTEPAAPSAIHVALADRGLRVQGLALTSGEGGARILPPLEHDLEDA